MPFGWLDFAGFAAMAARQDTKRERRKPVMAVPITAQQRTEALAAKSVARADREVRRAARRAAGKQRTSR